MNSAILSKISAYFTSQPIEMAWIFGSYSRSDETEASDLDILVKFNPQEKISLFKYARLINELEHLTGKKIDLVEEGQLKKFAAQTADSDKILFYERKGGR